MEFDSWEDVEKWSARLEDPHIIVKDISIKGVASGLVYPGRDSFLKYGLFWPQKREAEFLFLSDGVDLNREGLND